MKFSDVHSISQMTVDGTIKTDIAPPSRLLLLSKLTRNCIIRLSLATCSYERSHSHINAFCEKNVMQSEGTHNKFQYLYVWGPPDTRGYVGCGVSGGFIYATDVFWRMEDLSFVSSPCSYR